MIKFVFAEMENVKAHSEEFARMVLGQYLNINGDNLEIRRTKYGKPYLKDYPRTHYNISHTKGAIVCVVSNKPIGVDIERIRPVNVDIINRFFTENEKAYIFSSNKGLNDRYTKIWTNKEAYVKWLGKGMEIPFESFDVTSFRKTQKSYDNLNSKYCITICFDDFLIQI